MKEKEK